MILDTYTRNGTTMQMEFDWEGNFTIAFSFCGAEFERQFMDDINEAFAFWESLKDDDEVFGPTAQIIQFPRKIA